MTRRSDAERTLADDEENCSHRFGHYIDSDDQARCADCHQVIEVVE